MLLISVRKNILYGPITWLIGCLVVNHLMFFTSHIRQVYALIGVAFFILNISIFALEWSHLIDIQKERGVSLLWRGSFFACDRKTIGDNGVHHRNLAMFHFCLSALIILMVDFIG